MKKIIILLMMFLAVPLVFASQPIIDASKLSVVSTRYDPFPAEPGSYVNVWIKVQNLGAKPIDNVMFILHPEYPFSIDPNENASRFYGTIQGMQEILMKFKLRVDENAVEGDNNLELWYMSNNELLGKLTFGLNVYTSDANIVVQNIKTSQFSPGQTGNISIKIKNVADSPLKCVAFNLSLNDSFAILNGSNEYYVGKMKSGEEKTINFKLLMSPNSDLSVYNTLFTISYKDMLGNNFTKHGKISIVAYKKPNYLLTLEKSDTFTVNSTGSVIISIANTFPSKMKFTSLYLLPSNDYDIIGNNKQYIGNLDPDDFETAEFKIYVKTQHPILKVKINYNDNYNNEYSSISDIALHVYTNKELLKYGLISTNDNYQIILIIVVLIIVYFAYRKFRRKR